MSQFIDPRTEAIEELCSAVARGESAVIKPSDDAPGDALAPETALARESAQASQSESEPDAPAQQPEADEDEDLTIDPESHPDLQLLRTQQQYALAALAEGKSVAQAARIVEIDRTTLYRWMKKDVAFIRALAAWRRRTRRGARDRLLSMSDKAMRCLDRALDDRNLPAALAVLKGLGLLGGKAGAGKGTAPGRSERGPSASLRKKNHGPTANASDHRNADAPPGAQDH